jgi:hypothetical protein
MRRPRLFDLLKNKRFELSDDEFESNAEPNPFTARRNGMDTVVRQRGPSQGLDKTARTKTGSNSGVSGSTFDKIVRDVEDLDPYTHDIPRGSHSDGDTFLDPRQFDDDDDDLYLSTNDRSYRKREFNQEDDIDDIDGDADWEFMRSLGEDDDDMFDDEDDDEMSDLDDGEEIDPDSGAGSSRYDGVVRAVKGAYLVSKKQQPDDTYTEVWVYNTGKDYKSEAEIRKSILAGTDIDPTKNFSEDGDQEAVIDSIGNVQYITVTGLPD